jgi:hypothetical protein
MPCYDVRVSDDRYTDRLNNEIDALEQQIEKFEAVLCGIMRIDPTIINRINWEEVGITKRQHLAWWRAHQKRDAEHVKALLAKTEKAIAANLHKRKATKAAAKRK